MIDKKYIGALIILLVSSSVVYVVFPSEDLKMRIDPDKSTFYTYENRWLISGVEYNKLFNGTKPVYRNAKDVTVETIINDKINTTTIIRTTPYYSGTKIVDTYFFDGKLTDKESFPVSHTVEIYNGTGFIYQYEVQKLEYTGETKFLNDIYEMSFGKNMKVKWQEGNYYSKIYKYKNKDEGKLTIKYMPDSDYVKYEIRLFDPVGFNVRFHSCSHGLTEHSCLVDIQNLALSKKDFNLSMLLSDTNYNLEEYVTGMTIKEWKNIDTTFPTYAERLVEKICWNYDNVTLVNISYDCSYMENYQSGTEIKNMAQWKETKVNPKVVAMLEEGKKQKMSYGLINIPNYDSKAKYDASGIIKTINGTKTFLIEWTTPITKTESGWGSSGKIAIVNELTGEEYE